jgi:four helix bundle protein
MKTFKDIIAWQRGYELTLQIYKLTTKFPNHEEFGLKSQMRRAAVSIISNIAEGFKKIGLKERQYFYKTAECSLEELKCQSMLALDLGYFSPENYATINKLEDDTGKVLYGWIKSQK